MDTLALGEQSRAIIVAEGLFSEAGRARLANELYDHGLHSLVIALPTDYARALEYLTKRFETRETE